MKDINTPPKTPCVCCEQPGNEEATEPAQMLGDQASDPYEMEAP